MLHLNNQTSISPHVLLVFALSATQIRSIQPSTYQAQAGLRKEKQKSMLRHLPMAQGKGGVQPEGNRGGPGKERGQGGALPEQNKPGIAAPEPAAEAYLGAMRQWIT